MIERTPQTKPSLYNMQQTFNELRIILKIPEQKLAFPSLQSISSHYISTFFNSKTIQKINSLQIPESLKEESRII